MYTRTKAAQAVGRSGRPNMAISATLGALVGRGSAITSVFPTFPMQTSRMKALLRKKSDLIFCPLTLYLGREIAILNLEGVALKM